MSKEGCCGQSAQKSSESACDHVSGEHKGHHTFTDPDCLRCMRQKLRALCLVVFFCEEGEWRIGNFQGDKPPHHAEIDFLCMLRNKVPDTVAAQEGGMIINSDEELAATFKGMENILGHSSVIAAAVKKGSLEGIRLAWRSQDDPFGATELEIIQCAGNCPEGCE